MEHYNNRKLEDIQGELWKSVPGFEELYMISNKGRVKSLYRTVSKGKGYNQRLEYSTNIKKQSVSAKGYLFVSLCKSRKISGRRVHRLVAESFIPNPENKPQVNHKTGNKKDNCVEDLEWATNSENQLHSVRTGLRIPPKGAQCHNYGKRGIYAVNYGKAPKGSANNKSKLVLDTATGIFYDTLTEACAIKGYNYKHVSYLICKRINTTSLVYA